MHANLQKGGVNILGYAFLFLEDALVHEVKCGHLNNGFFSQCEKKHCTWTYKVTSAASICMHHRVVNDQHIFARNI